MMASAPIAQSSSVPFRMTRRFRKRHAARHRERASALPGDIAVFVLTICGRVTMSIFASEDDMVELAFSSGYDPETGICWRFRNKGDRQLRCKGPVCSKRYDERALVKSPESLTSSIVASKNIAAALMSTCSRASAAPAGAAGAIKWICSAAGLSHRPRCRDDCALSRIEVKL